MPKDFHKLMTDTEPLIPEAQRIPNWTNTKKNPHIQSARKQKILKEAENKNQNTRKLTYMGK